MRMIQFTVACSSASVFLRERREGGKNWSKKRRHEAPQVVPQSFQVSTRENSDIDLCLYRIVDACACKHHDDEGEKPHLTVDTLNWWSEKYQE